MKLVATQTTYILHAYHLLFNGHFLLPSLHRLHALILLLQGSIQNRHDCIDRTKTFTLSSFLEFGEAPWDLPRTFISTEYDIRIPRAAYHSSPTDSEFVGLKAPNIVYC